MSSEDGAEEVKVEYKTRYVGSLAAGKTISESINYGGIPSFLTYNGKTFSTKDKIIDNIKHEQFLPLEQDMIPYIHYSLDPVKLNKLKDLKFTDEQIFKLVYSYFNTFLDLEEEYKVLSTITLLETYIQNKCNSLAYLFYKGGHDSGKTRALELFNFLGYRPLMSSSLPPADIYEYIGFHDEGGVTILEDEAHTLSNDKNVEKMKIHRSGYRKGAVCPRIVDPSKNSRKQRFYRTFCSKIFAGYYQPRDIAFNSRCLPIQMIWGEPEKDEIEEKDIIKMTNAKFAILVWRMKHYFDPLPDIDLNLRGREKELWKSKVQLSRSMSCKDIVSKLANKAQKDKWIQRSESLEAYMVRAVCEQVEGYGVGQEIPFEHIWMCLLTKLGILTFENENKSSIHSEILGYKISKVVVGLKLGTELGGERFNRHKIGRTWKFDNDRLERLAKKYRIKINGLNGIND